jgi:hypothetical protein
MNIKILQNAEPTKLHQIELSRWENEGGAGPCDQQCGQQMLQKQARNILHPETLDQDALCVEKMYRMIGDHYGSR